MFVLLDHILYIAVCYKNSLHPDRLFGDDVTLHCSRPEGVRQDTALNWLHNNSVVDIANTQK